MGYESVINNEDSHFEEGILSVRGAAVKTINGCWVSLDLSMLLSQLNVAYIFFLFTCCARVCTVNLQVVLIWGNKGEFKTYLHEHPFSILSVWNLVKRAQMKKNRNVMLYEIAILSRDLNNRREEIMNKTKVIKSCYMASSEAKTKCKTPKVTNSTQIWMIHLNRCGSIWITGILTLYPATINGLKKRFTG